MSAASITTVDAPERTGRRSIEARVRDLAQLFDSMDPSPFREQDLAPSAAEYIVDSARELGGKGSLELHIYLDQAPPQAVSLAAENAIRAHFARRALHLRRQLRDLLRDGVVSLVIGIAFLVVFFIIGQAVVRLLGSNPWSTLARESLLIGGWVAMWRPLEIFLYAWWPIVRERRLHEGLSRMRVQIMQSTPPDDVLIPEG
jgi:hypothetical protein